MYVHNKCVISKILETLLSKLSFHTEALSNVASNGTIILSILSVILMLCQNTLNLIFSCSVYSGSEVV